MMRRTFALLATLSLLATAGATAVVDLSLEAMLDRADVIVYGTVADVAVDVVQEADGEAIRTRVAIDVERDVASPEDPREELVLSFLGGRTAAGDVTSVEGVPTFTVGEHLLVLAYLPDGAAPGGGDGEADGAGDDELVETRLASPIVGVWQGVWRLGPSGLGDARGRLLTPGPQGLAADGAGGDLDEVLDALAGWREGTVEILPDPAAQGAEPAADTHGSGVQDDTGDGPGAAPGGDADVEAPAAGGAPSPEAAAEEGAEAASSAGPGSAEAAGAPDDGAADDAEDAATDAPRGDDAADGASEGVDIRLREPESDALRRTVEGAAAAWREAGADVRVTFDEEATDAFLVGDPERLGPDALALAVHPAGVQGTEVWVAPGAVTRTDVVAYELATLAGVRPTTTGLLSGRFPREAEAPLTAADAAALRAAGEAVTGDLDADGDVDFYDLARLAEAYGQVDTRSPADLDGDGRVDDVDVDLLRERYEFGPPSATPPEGTTGTEP